jgi:hypothetical protein
MKKRTTKFVGLAICGLIGVGLGLLGCHSGEESKPIIVVEPPEGVTSSDWTPIREDWQPMVEKISLWEKGEEQIIAPEGSGYTEMGRTLITTLHKLDLQARCVFSGERIQEIKRNDNVVEIVFKQADDFPISQWIEEEERSHIPTDENGYRILENVRTAIFVLEDTLDEGLGAHVLVGSEFEGKISYYSCWAVKQEGSEDLDRSWVAEIEEIIKEAKNE